jgi:ribosome maturation factor RimP
MENKIAELIEDTIIGLGFELVRVAINGSKPKIVEILIERLDGEKVQIADCRSVSHNISAILDIEDVISGKYFLEVSSAGVERPLVKEKDFERFQGREIKLRLKEAWNGNLTYKGKLLGMEGGKIKLQSKNVELSFDYDNIKKANLIFTEEMFKASLNSKNKKKGE